MDRVPDAFSDNCIIHLSAKKLASLDEIEQEMQMMGVLWLADSDEAGHAFQIEAGHPFRFEAGHRSDLKSATWRHSGGSRRCCSCFSTWVKRAKHGAERAGSSGTARGRPGSQQEGPARDAACPCS